MKLIIKQIKGHALFKLNQIHRLVAYGCSYTQGAELADADFIPGLTIDQINSEKNLLGNPGFYNKYLGSWFADTRGATIREKEILRAWPSKLIKELGVQWSYLNRARPGSSMQEIVFTLEKDLYNGVIGDNDLIIIGITSPLRVLRFNDQGDPQSLVCTDLDSRWHSPAMRELFIQQFVNEYWELYHWYQSINYIDLLSEKFNNRILQQYLHLTYTQHTSNKELKTEFLKITNNLENCNSIVDSNLSFYTTDGGWDNTCTHGFHHPYESVHASLAKRLAIKIKEKYA
jgi:hypothetical protein